MKVAISQSNYIPWKGYFDLISKVDVFVLYDDMQYTRRDWRNRNKIKTPQGLQWLTIPVEVKGKYLQKINETRISDPSWAGNHLKSIELNYKKAAYYDVWFPKIAAWYAEAGSFEYLSEVNHYFLREICKCFKIETKLVDSRDFQISGAKTDALISVIDQLSAVSEYFSGPSAKNYLEEAPFNERNIEIKWMEYTAYPEYSQTGDTFEHGVSILDAIFQMGIRCTEFMKFK